MNSDHADISSRRARELEQLRAAGIATFFRATQVVDAGFTRDQLRTLVRHCSVERVGRGLYRLADAEPTEHYSLAMACARVPRSVVCLLSALRVHEIGTQAPSEVWLAIPHKASEPRLRELRLRTVRFTSPARTIVDCFRFERLLGPEIPMEALQDGLRQRKVTIGELSRAEEVLPSRRLRAALDV